MELNDSQEAVLAHLRAFFEGHDVEAARPAGSVSAEGRAPDFAVAHVGPGPRLPHLWTQVSLGCWEATHEGEHGLEFAIIGPAETTDRLDELLALTAFYHCGPATQRLDHGHTIPIGQSWLPGSVCDHLLVSLPYPLGPAFEACEWTGGHARILWLLPISEAERAHKAEHGLEALEERFDAAGLQFWDPQRRSVV